MVVKIYISGISGNKEVKKRQQRVLMILDSKNIKYDVIDITEPGKEADKDFMQNNAKSNGGTVSDPNPRSPLPPQLFNDDEYCGDYDQFDLANEVDTLEQFLKVEPPQELPQRESEKDTVVNGDAEKDDIQEQKDNSQEKESGDADKPEETKESSDAKEKIPSRETTPSDRKTSKEPSPAKDAIQETETEKEPVKETSPERQKSDVDDATSVPLKEKSPSPAKQDDEVKHSKEPSPAKEDDTGTKLSKESTPIKDDETESKQSKETTPEEESVNENGTASSREQSEEKVIESKKDNPSESLIASEQTAAAE